MLSVQRLSMVLGKLHASQPSGTKLIDYATALNATWQQKSQPFLIVNNGADTTATVIFSHGLGDTGNGWAQGFEYEVAPQLRHIRFVFPTARSIPVTLNGGMRMPAWYDIPSLDRNRLLMEAEGITDSAALIQSIAVVEADRLAKHGASKRVVIGGFSQGAALSLLSAHTFPDRLAGVAALSGYLTAQTELKAKWEQANSDAPLFMAHGQYDPVVPYESGSKSYDLLVDLKKGRLTAADAGTGRDWSFNTYPMEHTSSPAEMQDFVAFLRRVVPRL